MVLRKTKGGKFEVRSQSGKRLSKPMSKRAAAKRLGQIEHFKKQRGSAALGAIDMLLRVLFVALLGILTWFTAIE